MKKAPVWFRLVLLFATLAGGLAQDDYFYMRVAQIDGEAAWVSPVWIGEQSSAKK